ncbi:DUF1488 family protein [Microbulbifer sp. GL-2]|uniref:DUF1488 family protein n=1 Tax=Microbulbifer sp. GL-2 TaxID=2591606 RepID=UPI001162DC08|nr:DUF1488 family protein [Microbulbifer sp. GL-2]BBM00435.1 hypothetical protein GL2_05090 [Microbulbifer sp. GL-2]
MYEMVEIRDEESKGLILFSLINPKKEKIWRFSITREALNDHFQTEDSFEKARENFELNRDFVLKRAEAVIAAGAFDGEGVYLLEGKTINLF